MTNATPARIPDDLRPADGRFGCGPSKVRPEALARLADAAVVMGTSHRQRPVKDLVARVRGGIAELFAAPDGYEVALGNGGTTAFWDAAAAWLVRERPLHLSYGEFSSKFAKATAAAPFLAEPIVIEAEPGDAPEPARRPGGRRDRLGAQRDLDRGHGRGRAPRRRRRRPGARRRDLRAPRPAPRPVPGRRLLLRAAEGLRLRRRPLAGPAEPGGDRPDRPSSTAPRAAGSPAFLSLATALENSRKDQTYNTPAVATLLLLADQLEWMLDSGGLDWCVERCRASSGHLYGWAEASEFATPFVADPAKRSGVVGTIDFDEGVDAAALAATLRANGIVDTEPYRKLGRNQLRIGMFPAVDPADVEALTACIDWVVEHAPDVRR